MNEDVLQLIMADLMRNPRVREICELRQMQGAEKVHHLAESIRNNPRARRNYENLTDEKLNVIIRELETLFGHLHNCTIEDWANDNVVNQIAQAHLWLRLQLQKLLNFKVDWSVVSKIMNAVFGNVPVISVSLKRYLYDSGCLQNPNTQDICLLLTGLHDFYNRNRDDLFNILNELLVYGAFSQGIGLPIEENLIVLIPILLTGISRIICNELNRNQQ